VYRSEFGLAIVFIVAVFIPSFSFSGFTLIFWILFVAFYVWQIASFVLSIFRLVDMYNFFTHLLKIPDVRTRFVLKPLR
jgi:hypothetical protein